MPSIPRKKSPTKSRSKPKQDAFLLDVARKTFERLGQRMATADAEPTPVAREAFYRDMASTLFLLGGVRPADLAFMHQSAPDGSLEQDLSGIVDSLLWSSTPEGSMAMNPNLIDDLVADFGKLGIVGERKLALGIYLVGTSRLLDRPLSAIVQGHSSSGKSFITETLAKLFPTESVLHATRMTPQALFYYKGGLAHKFVVAGERSRKQDDDAADATAALRQLQSEGRITKLATGSKDGKPVSHQYEQIGPIAYIETTTLSADRIFPEDLNGALLLRTDESEDHTRQIIDRAASRHEGQTPPDENESIVAKHRAFQASLQRHTIVIPYARQIAQGIPTKKVAARRVAKQILAVIEAVTLLHQHQRKRDKQGRLIATLADYEVAKSILVQPLGESLGVSASPARFYQTLAAHFPGEKVFTSTEAQQLAKSG